MVHIHCPQRMNCKDVDDPLMMALLYSIRGLCPKCVAPYTFSSLCHIICPKCKCGIYAEYIAPRNSCTEHFFVMMIPKCNVTHLKDFK